MAPHENAHDAPGRSSARTLITRGVAALGLLSATLIWSPTAASAASFTFTVDSLAYGGDDDDPGDQSCDDGTGVCTLRVAMQEANALNAGGEHDVAIVFDDALEGFIEIPNDATATGRMQTGVIAAGLDVFGAAFHATAPMTIDFDGRVGVGPESDFSGTGFFIDGPGVTLQNFTAEDDETMPQFAYGDVAGIMASETAIVVSDAGDGATLDNGILAELQSIVMERGVVLLDGADDVTIRGVTFDDYRDFGGAIRLDAGTAVDPATISGLTLDGVEMLNTTPGSFYFGIVGDFGGETVLNDLSIVDSTFSDFTGNRIWLLEGVEIDGATVQGNTFENYPTGVRNALDFETGSLSDVTFTMNTFTNIDSDIIFDFINTTLTNVAIVDNDFVDADPGNFFDARFATITGLDVSSNTFDTVSTRGNFKILDLRGGVVDGVTFADNTITGGELTGGALDVTGVVDPVGVEVTGNTFTEVASNFPMVWAEFPGADNLVQENSWTNPDDTLDVGWIFVFDGGGVPAGEDTGWDVLDNQIAVAPGTNEAPIRVDSGLLPVERNTFAAPARGTTPVEDDAALSETGGSWFVWNVSAAANGKARTWYPTSAEVDEATDLARIRVIPPQAAESEVPAPGTPVAVDVYYSPGADGERQADVYLGRVSDLSAGTTFVIECPDCSADGFVRVQTIAADGGTTQYSRTLGSEPGTVVDLDDVGGGDGGDGDGGDGDGGGDGGGDEEPTGTIDLADGQNIIAGSVVNGTGEPGATVRLLDEATGRVLCETTVASNGTWSCTLPDDLTGDVRLAAVYVTDGVAGDPFDRASVNVVAARTAAPAPAPAPAPTPAPETPRAIRGGDLARTGTDGSRPLTGLGLGLLSVGALLVISSRRACAAHRLAGTR